MNTLVRAGSETSPKSGPAATLPEGTSEKRHGRSLQAIVIFIVAGLVLLSWVGVGTSLYVHHQNMEQAAQRNVQNLVRVIDAQVRGQLDAIDVSLIAAASTLPLLQGHTQAHDPEAQALLKVLLTKSAPVRAMWVTDEHGNMLHDSDSLTSVANYAHREYFKLQRDNPMQGLYVGQPIVNNKGVWFVSLSRRINKPDGSFGGVVVAALEPLFFERLFAKLDVGANGSLLILSSEFNVVARVPPLESLRGQSVVGKTNLPKLVAQANEGLYQSHSAADGLERIHAYRKVDGYPMVVVAGLGQAEVMASWWRTALVVLGATVALSALLAALGWRVLRELTTSRALQNSLQQAKGRADAALQELEGVLEAIPDLLFEVDQAGRIHGYKGQRDDLLYLPESAFLGKLASDIMPPEVTQVLLLAIAEAAQQGTSVGHTYSLDLPGGRHWFELSVARKGGTGAEDARFVLLARDISERMAARAALEESNLQLTRSNTDLEQFAYAASHDLLEPLRSVAGSVQLLKKRYEGKLDERADTFIAHAVGGVHRMQALIADLLTYSRLSTGGAAMTTVPLESVLANACDNLQVAMAESAAQITHDPLPLVHGDAGQLSHLMQNLIANALKFRGDKPAVLHIGARYESGEWVVSVADQGIGIERQHFMRIFGIFKRLHTREEYAGNGIGLTLCQRIVERHGGRIWVESELGQGTTFFFSLPDRVI